MAQTDEWIDAFPAIQQAVKDEDMLAHFEIQGYLCNSTLFTAKDGYIGLSVSAQQGVVAATAGRSMPVVLRKNGSYFEWMGTYFVLGLRDGEAQQSVKLKSRCSKFVESPVERFVA